MKKLFAFLLAFSMLFCVAFADTNPDTVLVEPVPSGIEVAVAPDPNSVTWYMNGIQSGEYYLESDMGFTLTMTAGASDSEGTYAFAMGDENTEGTWTRKEDGSFSLIMEDSEAIGTIDYETQKFTLIVEEGVSIIFGLEPLALNDNMIAAEAITDFDGVYDATKVNMFGAVVDVQTLAESGELDEFFGSGSTLNMTIENGSVDIFGGGAQQFSFADGMLKMSIEGMDDYDQTIQFTEDGTLVYSLMGMNFYFERHMEVAE